MKIRIGFVSNSSSASFLVVHHKHVEGKEKEKVINALNEFGFFLTTAFFPDHVEQEQRPILDEQKFLEWVKDMPDVIAKYNYGYYVICNEFTVHKYLIKNKIPYYATCNNDEFIVHYDGVDVKIYPNYGQMFLMGTLLGEDGIIEEGEKPLFFKTKKPKEFLESDYW